MTLPADVESGLWMPLPCWRWYQALDDSTMLVLMPGSCWSLTFTSPTSSYHLHWGNLVLWLKLSGEESLSLWNAHLSKVCSCQVSTAPRDCISKTRANIVSFHMHELESDHLLHHQSAMSDHHHQHSRTLKLLWETWTQFLWYYYWSRTQNLFEVCDCQLASFLAAWQCW